MPLNLSSEHFCEPICDVDVASLVAWLGEASWTVQAYAEKPQRVFDPPGKLIAPIVERVLSHFPPNISIRVVVGDVERTSHPPVATAIMLSRMQPGQSHGFHVDWQPDGWLTRVHVPIITNPRAWLGFAEQEGPIHLEVGRAYTFNTHRRHAFANDGATERVHLLFDVIGQ